MGGFHLSEALGILHEASENEATGGRSKLPKHQKSERQEISPVSAQETPPSTGFPVKPKQRIGHWSEG